MVFGRFRGRLEFLEVPGCFQENFRNISEGFQDIAGVSGGFCGFQEVSDGFSGVSVGFKVFLGISRISNGFIGFHVSSGGFQWSFRGVSRGFR